MKLIEITESHRLVNTSGGYQLRRDTHFGQTADRTCWGVLAKGKNGGNLFSGAFADALAYLVAQKPGRIVSVE